MKTVQVRSSYNNWIKDETKHEMKMRDAARLIAKNTDLDDDWEKFKRLRNSCTIKQRNDKKCYLNAVYSGIEEERDTSKLFATTRKLLGWKQLGPPTSFNVKGHIIRKQKELADHQVNYYEEKINKIKEGLPKVNLDPLYVLKRLFSRWKPAGGHPHFSLKSVTEREVAGLVSKLKNSHAFGIDRLDAAIIKIAAPVLLKVLTHIINLSLGTSTFPGRWKIARILPLRKSRESDSQSPASYRPVSQLPVMSKLTERAVQCQILSYLEDSNLLSPQHHAYRTNHNTSTALIHLMDSLATAADANLITATMCIDLTAAFDCVPHSTLLDKLSYYGLDVMTMQWIRSYLDARSSFVSIGSADSRYISTPQGVPQGSVLGPLLYLLFVNEMTSIVEDGDCSNQTHSQTERLFPPDCNLCGVFPMYADDGQYQISSNNRNWNQDKLERNFWEIRNYLNANGLNVNQSKTKLVECMTYQKKTRTNGIPPDLTVSETITDRNGTLREQDELITDSGNCRILGLTFRGNGTWENHLNTGKKSLLPALRRQIGLLSRIAGNMSEKARLNLVNCLIISRLSYMICVWGNTNATQIRKAQVVQNQAGRLVTQLPKRTRQKMILERCKWMQITDMTEYQSLCQLWKTVRWGVPRNLREKISTLENNKLMTTEPRLLTTSNNYRWKSIENWNQLPDYIRQENSIKRFKIQLKNWIKERNRQDDRQPDD